jgi:hypothetical protein
VLLDGRAGPVIGQHRFGLLLAVVGQLDELLLKLMLGHQRLLTGDGNGNGIFLLYARTNPSFAKTTSLATMPGLVVIRPDSGRAAGKEVCMFRVLSVIVGLALVASVIAGPVWFAVYQLHQQRNFKVVQEGVLYRSGQMTVDGLRRAVHDYGIRTIITLRDPLDPSRADTDRQEEEFCTKEDVQFVRLPPRGWADTPYGPAPVEENMQQFLRVLRDPRNQPVLLHCFAGIHRTGAYCAVYRMEFERWTNEQAMAELRSCGYSQLDEQEDVLGYLERYQPVWKKK